MLQVAPMGSTPPNNWKRPWIDGTERPAINLPEPTRLIYSKDRQSSEPAAPNNNAERRDSFPSLKRSSSSLHNVDPEDRELRAVPEFSHLDSYTRYLLSQDSSDNSAKRMRMASNPWLDLKGKSHDAYRLDHGSMRQAPPRPKRDQSNATTVSNWTPMPIEAARPKDLSNFYVAGGVLDTENCNTCYKAKYIAPDLGSGLQRLYEQLKFLVAKAGNNGKSPPEPDSPEDPVPDNLLDILSFSRNKLNDTMKIVEEILFTFSVGEDGKASLSGAIYGNERHTLRAPHGRTPGSDDGRKEFDRTSSREQYLPATFSRSSPAHQLPSPESIQRSKGSVSGVSPVRTNAYPTTGHLHDLQHQLSSKVSAYQGLQTEHEKLLTVYSRIQAKCASLEKKYLVADSELENSNEERACLQVQVESLEQQVSELQANRDQAQKQSVANGSQYIQIMAMSSKLQAQGAADLKRYKVDREMWASEKEDLETRVKLLEKAQGAASMFAATLAASGRTIQEQNTADEIELANMSFDKLREEIMTLRRNVREASDVIQTMKDEGAAITRLTSELGIAGERLIQLGVATSTNNAVLEERGEQP